MNIIYQFASKVRNFLGIKVFQLFHCFLSKGPRERGEGRERRKGEEEEGGGRRRKKGEERKWEERRGRGREGEVRM